MKRLLLILLVIVALPVIGFAVYWVAFFTVDPSFSASALKQSSGDYRIEIDPNFVVFSVYSVTVSDANRVIAERDDPVQGLQHIIVPGTIPSGTSVTITCQLVYDRPMPSSTTRSVQLNLP